MYLHQPYLCIDALWQGGTGPVAMPREGSGWGGGGGQYGDKQRG